MAQADFTRIATNIGALNALNSLRNINNNLGTHQERLATGKRINSAADDPAGLTIATKMMARSEGLKTAISNIGDAKNMLSVAEAGLGELTDILVTMRSKSEQAASDTLGASERAAIASQLESLAEQIDDIVNETKWNGVKLLDGTVNKRFQTGADEGEYTDWVLTQAHTAGSLNVSTAYASTGVENQIVSTGLSGVNTAAAFNGLTELATGSFNAEVLASSASTTDGYVDVQGDLLSGLSGAAIVSSPGTDELTSGTYTMTIDEVSSSVDVSYTIRNASTGAVVTSVDNVDISNGQVIGDVDNDTTNGDVGIDLTFTTDATGLVVGDRMTFEYIAGGEMKMELNDASDIAQQIDQDGSSGGNSGVFAYVDQDATFDTGRGVTINTGLAAAAIVGDTLSFDYHQAGEYVVDVSTAQKAASYMTTVNNSLDIVNDSMADLGSLMARLSIKEEAVSVAQVNTEAAHNRIMNADMAFEQVEATKFSILQQTAITMLSQANTSPQGILGLFR